jgi:hypothetical protein
MRNLFIFLTGKMFVAAHVGMNRMARLFGSALLVAVYFAGIGTACAYGDDPLSAETIAYGVGKDRCGGWNMTHTEAYDPLGLAQTSWVQGFVTGVGFFSPMKAASGKDIKAYMNAYCRANPSNTIFDGATQLVKDWRDAR